mgnify:CR=1 FL=1
MNYYSLNNKNHKVTFQEAVIKGLAPDRGLYFPETISPLPDSFFQNIETLYNEEIAFLDNRRSLYIYLWISTLIVFLIILFSTSDYINFKYL